MNDIVDRFRVLNDGPPTEINVTLPGPGETRVKVLTRRLAGSPHWLYSAYTPKFEQPILEWISWPTVGDLADAYTKAMKEAAAKAKKEGK